MLSKGALHGHALFLRRLAPSLSLSSYLFTFGAPKCRDLGGIGASRRDRRDQAGGLSASRRRLLAGGPPAAGPFPAPSEQAAPQRPSDALSDRETCSRLGVWGSFYYRLPSTAGLVLEPGL